jgi:Rieske 2Fe-2S family protein
MMERTLHRDFYLSDEIFRREREKIFYREWFCGGREEEIAQAGGYLVLDVAGESILVLRTREGRLAAYYNVCRHRGSRLLGQASKGTLPGAIRCPYHSWTYTLDGQLRTAPFLEAQEITRSELNLFPVGIEAWGGFFFLNLSPADAAARHHRLTSHLGLCPLVPAFKKRGGSELDCDRGIPHREGAWAFTETGTSDVRSMDSTLTSKSGIKASCCIPTS